jgi:adenosylcobinamide amidohydrolase
MEKMNLSEKNLIQNMIVIEEAKAITMNDALTRTLVHYHKFVPLSVR